jgi:ribonuclease P protein component
MLPKINRIKKKKDFEIIFKNSKNLRSNLFILKIKKNNLGLDRFGLVVSQKVSKRAVIRNKVRRRLAEAIKTEIENIETGLDLVLVALPGIEKEGFPEIKESVKNALAKLGLIRKK